MKLKKSEIFEFRKFGKNSYFDPISIDEWIFSKMRLLKPFLNTVKVSLVPFPHPITIFTTEWFSVYDER